MLKALKVLIVVIIVLILWNEIAECRPYEKIRRTRCIGVLLIPVRPVVVVRRSGRRGNGLDRTLRILERLGGTAANLTSQAIEAIRGLTGLSERIIARIDDLNSRLELIDSALQAAPVLAQFVPFFRDNPWLQPIIEPLARHGSTIVQGLSRGLGIVRSAFELFG